MSESKTIPHPTWQITAYKKGLVWKVIAVSPGRTHIIHQDKVTDADLENFDPASRWATKKAPKIVDFAAQVNAAKPQKGAA